MSNMLSSISFAILTVGAVVSIALLCGLVVLAGYQSLLMVMS